MMVTMAGLQVFIVQFFFKVSKAGSLWIISSASLGWANCSYRVLEKDTCKGLEFVDCIGGMLPLYMTWESELAILCSFISRPILARELVPHFPSSTSVRRDISRVLECRGVCSTVYLMLQLDLFAFALVCVASGTPIKLSNSNQVTTILPLRAHKNE